MKLLTPSSDFVIGEVTPAVIEDKFGNIVPTFWDESDNKGDMPDDRGFDVYETYSEAFAAAVELANEARREAVNGYDDGSRWDMYGGV